MAKIQRQAKRPANGPMKKGPVKKGPMRGPIKKQARKPFNNRNPREKRPFNKHQQGLRKPMRKDIEEKVKESDGDDDNDNEEEMDYKSIGQINSSDKDSQSLKVETPKEKREKREKKKFDFERNSRTIFVGNLPKTYEHRDVEKLFKSCGPVESARIRSIVPEKEKLSQKVAIITKRLHPKVDSVNAYVVFKSSETIEEALKLNGRLIDGHHIRVDRAQRPKAKKETLTSRKKSVFVGNLRFDIRDDELINHFKKVGSVNYVRIVRDSSTGLGKGFGFVVFDERASVKKALELNDSKFKGRALRIKKVEEQEQEKKKKKEKKTKKKKEEEEEKE